MEAFWVFLLSVYVYKARGSIYTLPEVVVGCCVSVCQVMGQANHDSAYASLIRIPHADRVLMPMLTVSEKTIMEVSHNYSARLACSDSHSGLVYSGSCIQIQCSKISG